MSWTPSWPRTPISVRDYRLSHAAQQDLRDIRTYSKDMFGVARDYMRGIRAAFGLLRERPFAGAAEHDLGDGMRGSSHRSHRIYYVVKEHQVLIVRILHHAQDAARWVAS